MVKKSSRLNKCPVVCVSSSLSTLQKPPVTPRVPEITLLPTCLLAWFEVDTKRWLSPCRVNEKSGGLKCQWQLLSLHFGVWIFCNGAAAQSESNRKDGPFRSPAWGLSYVELLENQTSHLHKCPTSHATVQHGVYSQGVFSHACSHMQAHTFTHRWTEKRCRVEGFLTEVRAKVFEIRSCLQVTLVRKRLNGPNGPLSVFDNVWLPSKFNFLQSDFFDHCGQFWIH